MHTTHATCPQGFMTIRASVSEGQGHGFEHGRNAQCRSMPFDSCFLHDGHLSSRLSSWIVFAFDAGVSPLSVTGVDSADLEGTAFDALSKDHFTGIRFFRLCFVSTTECMNKLRVDYVRKWVRRVSPMTRCLQLHVRR